MKLLGIAFLCWWLMSTPAEKDRFTTVKADLAAGACTHIEFMSILESDVFEMSDTARGTADIARDGRFSVTLGTDRYLYDLHFLYSYSQSNNQVVIEAVEDTASLSKEISFVTRLDRLYLSDAVEPGRVYRLWKRPGETGNTPDSLTVHLAADTLALERLEYFDINDELNVIVILEQTISPSCDDTRFVPDFPDSVETVRL